MPADPEDKPTPGEDPILEEAAKRFALCEEAEQKLRVAALDDLKFRAGEQWSPALRSARDRDARPCLTLNVLPARERQILNDQRQNRQAIKVSPVDDVGDPETAEVIQGMIRHIEYDSNADIAYDTAFASAVRMGFGYYIVMPEYEYPGSKQQCIRIKRVRNAFSIYMDPNCQEPDYSDAKFGFKFTWYTKAEFKREFPKSELASLDQWTAIGDRQPGWIQADGSVRVAEYFKLGKDEKSVEWYLLNAMEVMDQTTIPCRWIPIVPVLGDELEVDGQRILEGMVRHAKDPQRMVNYMASAEVEAIALAPKAPFLAAVGQTEDLKEWETLNIRTPPVLRYRQTDVGGQQAPPPSRQVAEPAIQAITEARLHFTDDLKSVTGIYDAQLGARSNETTGKAILQRKQQGEISNFHYADNLTRAIRHGGRIIIDMIPKIYDAPRVMRIIGEDGEHSTVKINQEFQEGAVKRIYDVTVGQYDVVVSTGPSYQTRRQEAVDSIVKMTQAYPQLMQIAGDLLAKNMDWPGAEELAERLKKTLPPELRDDNEEIPPQAQAIIAQHKQQLMALNEYAKSLEQQVGQLQFEQKAKTLDNQYKALSEKFQAEVKLAIAEIQTKAQIATERATFVNDMEKQFHVQAHERAMSAQEHQQGMVQADQQAQNAQQQQASDQAFQAQQAQAQGGSAQ